jgi:hypothetical protein
MRVSSETPATDHQRLIRSLELKLELLDMDSPCRATKTRLRGPKLF